MPRGSMHNGCDISGRYSPVGRMLAVLRQQAPALPLLQAALHAHSPSFSEVTIEELLPRQALQGFMEAEA